MKSYQVDENGFYGEFGGAYVPEILYKCVHDLQEAYLPIIESEAFKREYHALLKDYVGRPSPLYPTRSTTPSVRFSWPSRWVRAVSSQRQVQASMV